MTTSRLHSSSFSGLVFRILQGNPKKDLLWSLWVGTCLVIYLDPSGSVNSQSWLLQLMGKIIAVSTRFRSGF